MSAGLDAGLGADGGGRNRGWTLAIDFGTSNTSASWRDDVGNVREVRLGTAGNLMPSAVFAGPEGLVVGDLAIRSAQADPGAFEPAPKRRLAEMSVPLGGRTLSGDSLASAVLADVLQRAVRVTGSQPAEVVLTYPDRWDTELQHLLVQAAVAAGIPANQVRLLSEARAAAWFYTGWGTPPAAGERIGVFDFGAGTCDVAVLEKQPDGSFTVLAAEGVDGLGGRDFDGRVWQWVRGQLASTAPELLAELDSPAGVRGRLMVMDRIREAKETLSGLSSATIVAHGRVGEMVLSLTRGEFEEIIADDVEEAVALAERVFGTTGAPHRLFLTGGSSLIPLVHAELGRLAPVAELGDPQTVVSQGALRAEQQFSGVRAQAVPAQEVPARRREVPDAAVSSALGAGVMDNPASSRRKNGRRWKVLASLIAIVALGGAAAWGITQLGGSDEGRVGADGGALYAWGENEFGQATVPAALVDQKITKVAAGYGFSLALTDEGLVHAWGDNESGQLDVPAELAGLKIVDISSGYFHSLALTQEGKVFAWGSDASGKSQIPAGLSGENVVAIDTGTDYSLALTEDGKVYGWGSEGSDEYGAPDLLSGKRVVQISAGPGFSLALTEDGTLHQWGSTLGLNLSDLPDGVDGTQIVGLAAGSTGAMAWSEDGSVYSWGASLAGWSAIEASVAEEKVVDVKQALHNSMLLTEGGTAYAWGSNSGSYAEILALSDITVLGISPGVRHSLVIVES